MNEQLLEQLELYLAEYYVDPEGAKYSLVGPAGPKDKYEGVLGAIRWEIDKLFDRLDLEDTFSSHLFKLIKQKGMTEVEVYKKVHLDRRLFSKLRRDRNYHPNRRTIWMIALSLELNLEELKELLKAAGYYFFAHDKEDIIMRFFFENQIYDLFTINEILDYYGFEPLGN